MKFNISVDYWIRCSCPDHPVMDKSGPEIGDYQSFKCYICDHVVSIAFHVEKSD